MDNILNNLVDKIYRQNSLVVYRDSNDSYKYCTRLNKIVQSGGKYIKRHRPTKSIQEVAKRLEEKAQQPKRIYASGRLRYDTLKKYNSTCLLCGASPRTGALVDVDHIKPISKYPELVNDPDNLQVLCSKCNIAKFNRTEDDFR